MSKKIGLLNEQLELSFNTNIAPLCACGCGLPVKWNKWNKRWNTIIKNHYYHTSEYKEKMSKQQKERWLNPEFREEMVNKSKKRCQNPEFRSAISERLKVRWQDPKYRELKSKQQKDLWGNPGYRKKMVKVNTELWLNSEHRDKVSIYWNDLENKDKRSKQSKERWGDSEIRKNIIIRMKEYWNNEQRERQSERSKELWQNSEFRNKILKAIFQTPNKPETIINMLTPDEVRYVGNRAWWRRIKVLVNGVYTEKNKNPDFKVKDQNKVIEIFGTYWHKDDDPEALINAYKDTGIDCLVIWEHEIYQELEKVLERIGAFLGKESWQMTLDYNDILQVKCG